MKKAAVKIINLILVAVLVATWTLETQATNIQDIKEDLEEDNEALDALNDELLALQDEQDLLEEIICDLDSELLNTMTEIGLLEAAITEKEADIAVKEADIAQKEADIAVAQGEYEDAKATEEKQYADMVQRIQYVYEQGDTDYLELLFSAESFSSFLNRTSYVEAIYEYDQKMLADYKITCELVKALWEQLEADKAQLEADKAQLEFERTQLEADKQGMEDRIAYLDDLLAKKQAESDNFAAEIARTKQEANALKVKIQQEEAELRRLELEQQRQNAANGSYQVSQSLENIINNASGSDLGKQIARYGCQFIGNPYVWGGTSLTNGADCSGFVYRIYKDFGYNLSRTSYSQRSEGVGVDYANAQPGDLICYDGHIGIYIGGGYIVHASNKKSGIKVSKATYRTILAVRRII
ncbi:MAG: C40 family peptidase [Lachnospiraceae bacterium]|nr:C40 family peptidase [Lachnospiraceae bacterium]